MVCTFTPVTQKQEGEFLYVKPVPIYLHCILYKMAEYLSPLPCLFATNKPNNWWEIQLGNSVRKFRQSNNVLLLGKLGNKLLFRHSEMNKRFLVFQR